MESIAQARQPVIRIDQMVSARQVIVLHGRILDRFQVTGWWSNPRPVRGHTPHATRPGRPPSQVAVVGRHLLGREHVGKDAVVRADECTVPGDEHDGPPLAAHTGVHYRYMDCARGEVTVCAVQSERSLMYLLGHHVMAYVHHYSIGQLREYSALHRAHVAIVLAEVGGHGDDGRSLKPLKPVLQARKQVFVYV